ncbi:serine O-acetyltransferase [Salinisphaera sp. USBA-960]|uniref:serine O-acetyltransferase n=1 Tax=Salinisphaera orenii TaxID=856731 RepID=UPI000DBE461C|nr:serine O-acetyltransferase [Salifodinibacter halophilus]NNC25767.1 serine O-acetyltransferase [Salifodinibacter halophilus]
MWQRLREDIDVILDRDPAARSRLEVLFCYPGLHALWAWYVSHALWTRRAKWLARFVSNTARWLTSIEIHPGAQIGRRFFIDHGLGVVIGETTEIGDDCTVYQGVTLGGTRLVDQKRHPTLGDGVVIGAGAQILGPFTVGAGARVGSNAVVVKAVPPGCTAIGVPAKLVKCADGTPEDRRQATADRIGFPSYGVAQGMPDPVASGIDAMLDHIDTLERRQEQLETRLDQLRGEHETERTESS